MGTHLLVDLILMCTSNRLKVKSCGLLLTYIFINCILFIHNMSINIGITWTLRSFLYANSGSNEEFHLSDNQLMNVTHIMKNRREHAYKICSKHQDKLFNITEKYLFRLRYDPNHQLMYCENFKISSSTWASHFLQMNDIQIEPRTPIHKTVRNIFHPLYENDREKFFENGGISFIVVRDPFERLVSAYLDKMSKTYKTDNIRKKPRDGLVPTFSEFAQFVAVDAAVLTSKVNNHWKPIYFNCAPCIEKYKIIMKMETFSRDSQYLKQIMGLDIDINFIRKSGPQGHTSEQKTMEMINTLEDTTKRELLQI